MEKLAELRNAVKEIEALYDKIDVGLESELDPKHAIESRIEKLERKIGEGLSLKEYIDNRVDPNLYTHGDKVYTSYRRLCAVLRAIEEGINKLSVQPNLRGDKLVYITGDVSDDMSAEYLTFLKNGYSARIFQNPLRIAVRANPENVKKLFREKFKIQ